MSGFLEPAWFAELEARLADHIDGFGDASLQCLIGDGPDGDVKCFAVIDDGRLVDARVGSLDTADLTVTIGYDDAASIDRGELDPSVAYMQGRLKVSGDLAKLMQLLPLTRPGT